MAMTSLDHLPVPALVRADTTEDASLFQLRQVLVDGSGTDSDLLRHVINRDSSVTMDEPEDMPFVFCQLFYQLLRTFYGLFSEPFSSPSFRANSGDRWNVVRKNASLAKVGSRSPAATMVFFNFRRHLF